MYWYKGIGYERLGDKFRAMEADRMAGTDKNITTVDTKTDAAPVESGPVTPDTLTTAQLAQVVFLHAGSPYGSVEEWLKQSGDILGW